MILIGRSEWVSSDQPTLCSTPAFTATAGPQLARRCGLNADLHPDVFMVGEVARLLEGTERPANILGKGGEIRLTSRTRKTAISHPMRRSSTGPAFTLSILYIYQPK